jgi:uncharacterized protein DUF2786
MMTISPLMQLERLRRFQKCLRRASDASSPGEAQAAEAAARRLMEAYKIDPLMLTNKSLYDHTSFANNALLLKLREERQLARQHRRGAKKHKKVKPVKVKREPFKLRNVKFKRKRKPKSLPSPPAQLA